MLLVQQAANRKHPLRAKLPVLAKVYLILSSHTSPISEDAKPESLLVTVAVDASATTFRPVSSSPRSQSKFPKIRLSRVHESVVVMTFL